MQKRQKEIFKIKKKKEAWTFHKNKVLSYVADCWSFLK